MRSFSLNSVGGGLLVGRGREGPQGRSSIVATVHARKGRNDIGSRKLPYRAAEGEHLHFLGTSVVMAGSMTLYFFSILRCVCACAILGLINPAR